MTLVGANVLTTAILRRQAANAAETRVPPAFLAVEAFAYGSTLRVPSASLIVTSYPYTSVGDAPTSTYVYPNSLWVNGSTAHVAYWLGLIEDDAGISTYYDGESAAFFANGAGFPSANPLNFVQGATSIDSHNSENPGEDYLHVVFVANNFVQDSTVDTEYTNHRDRMSTLISHWDSSLGQNPIFWIQEDVPEGVMLTDPVSSATRDEFDDMLDEIRSGTHPDWFTTLLGAVQALQPSADVRLYRAGLYFQNVVQGTPLIDLDPDDFFVDTDPHGTDLHYAIKAMIYWEYTGRSLPATSTWATGLPATFISNYTTIRDRIADLVAGNSVTPQALSSNDWIVETSATPGGLDFTLDVDDIAEAISDLEYSTDDGSSWASFGSNASDTYTVTDQSGGSALDPETAYTCRVRAVNASGNGQASRSMSGTSAASGDTASTYPSAGLAVESYPYASSADTISSYPSASLAVESYAYSSETSGGSLTEVTFDGTNDYISATDASSSSAVLTLAMRISPDAWNSTDGLIGGFGSDGGLFSNGSDLLAWYEDDIGFTQGNLGGTVTSDTYSILVTVDYAGGLASSNSLHIQVNGSTLVTQSGTGSAIDWSGMTFLSQAASHYEGVIDFLWAGHTTNEDYADFFDGSDVPLTGFATEGAVDTIDPFLFFYGDSATTWNSGTDRDGNSYTMNGAVT